MLGDWRSDGSVRFEKVTGYNPKYPVLHDINLEIPAGQTIALRTNRLRKIFHRLADSPLLRHLRRECVGGHDTRSLTQQFSVNKLRWSSRSLPVLNHDSGKIHNKSTATNEEVIQASKIVYVRVHFSLAEGL